MMVKEDINYVGAGGSSMVLRKRANGATANDVSGSRRGGRRRAAAARETAGERKEKRACTRVL